MIDITDTLRQIVREEIARALSSQMPARLGKENEYLSQNDAAIYCGVTTATIRNWHAEGLRVNRTGRVVRYRREDLDAFMRQGKADPDALAANFLRG